MINQLITLAMLITVSLAQNFVLIQPYTGTVVQAGNAINITWSYDPAVIPGTTSLSFNLTDLTKGPNDGFTFAQNIVTAKASDLATTYTVPTSVHGGPFSITITINGQFYSSPSFTIIGSSVGTTATDMSSTSSRASSTSIPPSTTTKMMTTTVSASSSASSSSTVQSSSSTAAAQAKNSGPKQQQSASSWWMSIIPSFVFFFL
ncbi:hypothetical protein HDU76_000404 [Blyttiomyces sp. JEL0837]|nr:hypothetical protein HDU76_000404 [Blyttiomyces sp. JEL0837]